MLTVTTTATVEGVKASTRGITIPVGNSKNDKYINALEHILVSLSGCMAITLQFAAQRRKYAVDELTAAASLDFQENEDEPGEMIPHFHVEVSIKGQLTPEQIKHLERISVKCEVYKLLSDKHKKVTINLQPPV